MEHLKKTNLTIYSILLSLLLIINAVLGILLGMQSSASLKEQINSRMLDITKTAAAMINGDDLRDIKKEDKGTPKYEKIITILNYFREYTELQYIYCIKETKNGTFMFTIDTDPVDPGEYGDPVEYTEALHNASLGIPGADDDYYVDRWGSFYSAYCPVFDSDGNVGGIIAVDFNKDWYDDQMDAQRHTTVAVVLISVIICAVIIAVMSFIAAKRRKMNEHLSQQLSSTADIYIAMYEIDLISNTFNEVRNHHKQVFQISGGRNDCQEVISRLMEAYTDTDSREKMLHFADLSKLDKRLREHNTITEEFLSVDDKWCKARFIVSERLPDGQISIVMFIVEDIDDEKRYRDIVFDTAQHLSFQLRSIADIYTSVYDIDMINDSYTDISTTDMYVANIVGDDVYNAQETLKKAVRNLTNELYREDMLKFVEFSNIRKNISDNGIATIEFLNSRNKWCRGRFIVSELTDDGTLSHVLWAVENIDSERKERDDLRDIYERVVAANETKSQLISSISHEIKTPVSTVLGLNEMILRESGSDTISQYSENIKKESLALIEYLDDIIDFSNIEEGKIKSVLVDYDLSYVLDDLVDMIRPEAESKGLRLDLDINASTPKYLHGDEAHIVQIITNLLSNAVKYTDKGEVTLSINYFKIPTEPNTIMLMVSIKDTGIGIKPEDMDYLLSYSFKMNKKRGRKKEKAGLGLKITRHLLEVMGSSLQAKSTYGVGSDFSFSLKQDVVTWEAIGKYGQKQAEAPTVQNELPAEPTETAAPIPAAEEAPKAPVPPEDSTMIPEYIYGITEINPYFGIRNCGGKKEFIKTLGTFSENIYTRINDIQKCYNANDIPAATEKIRELIPELDTIGAVILAHMAADLEEAGNKHDIIKLESKIPSFFDRCRYLSEQLKPVRTRPDDHMIFNTNTDDRI